VSSSSASTSAKPVERAAEWIYQGVWGVLTSLFNVPRDPPELPAYDGHEPEKFKPSPNYLAMQKFLFWILLAIIDVVIVGGWIALAIAQPLVGGLLFVPMLIVAVVPDIMAYVAIHLRYDTMWYVMSDRSIRIRRGIWIIHETTITFENIQNVTVSQGPLQRWFGVATVVIQTAGGGGGGGHPSQQGGHSHMGMIEGVADAPRLRDLFLAKMGVSRGAGLGDDHHHLQERDPAEAAGAGTHADATAVGIGGRAAGWTPAHIIALREMLAEAKRANAAVG
jgi:membrane protein YdbS with pleckstrin-like domain